MDKFLAWEIHVDKLGEWLEQCDLKKIIFYYLHKSITIGITVTGCQLPGHGQDVAK